MGDTVRHDFKFKNTGQEPLIISQVASSCGCTVTDYPKKPVPVGNTGSVQAIFVSSKSKGKGLQNKVLYVYSNASEPVILLTLKGVIN